MKDNSSDGRNGCYMLIDGECDKLMWFDDWGKTMIGRHNLIIVYLKIKLFTLNYFMNINYKWDSIIRIFGFLRHSDYQNVQIIEEIIKQRLKLV